MKKFIHKTNTYLLENYPILWNTKLVWMLGIAAILHLIFYLFGLGSFTNVETLHNRNAIDVFYRNGMIFFSVMVSIILLVAWLILMFKNNAFKNFYPTKKTDIFKQFVLYFVIILSSITFYYSYMLGVKTFISTYKDVEMIQDIAIANETAPFFSHGIEKYTISNANYPEPLDDLYCLVKSKKIDYYKKYYSFLDKDYQFYDLISKTKLKKDIFNKIDYYSDSVYKEETDSTITYYYINEVQDVTECLKTTEPSYYNYSNIFYSSKTNNYNSYNSRTDHYYDFDFDEKFEAKEALFKLNKAHYELLERNNKDEIKGILTKFLQLAKKYKIKHNLNDDTWLNLVYNPSDFKLKNIINDDYRDYKYNDLAGKSNITPFEELYLKLKTEYYLESNDLNITFENIEEIKTSPLISGEIHSFLWISFSLSLLILVFRLTGLKPLLFSIISTCVLMIFVALIAALFNYLNSSSRDIEYFMLYFIFILGTIILTTTLFMITKIKKQIAAIFINITLVGFVPYIFLILGIITGHQSDACKLLYDDYTLRKENCFMLLKELEPEIWSYIFITIGFIFVFFFSKQVLNWKAMPEG